MAPADTPSPASDDRDGIPPIDCPACQSALESASQNALSFLLLDQFRIPLIGCDDHLEQFASICGLTTEDDARLLSHYPAGGISCPACRLAPQSPGHVMIPVAGGATVLLACPRHQSEIATRFETGLQTQEQLQIDLGSSQSV